MADDYWLHSAADVTPEQALSLLAHLLGADRTRFGLARGDTLTATAWQADDPEDIESGQHAGVDQPRLGVLFQVRAIDDPPGHADREAYEVVDAALALLRAYPAEAVVLLDTETMLRHTGGEIVLDSGWSGWSEIPTLAPVTDAYPMRALP
ncbi:SitI3 family protein [Solwaraspora sp. WMMD406]|uniref:SitI3 family protein n=1 Tax=Solwaraspora sp. WMMD406 TaxID=3016095 RepID=UPI0024176922|nr:SitI3 family protein [Solwaraspora sp. WMMD406]MDG4764052.1 SitI3 family protein [Solwaraspora sp. WMMD406]